MSNTSLPESGTRQDQDPLIIVPRSDEWKLAFLRIQLFTAMQQLKGDALSEFWKLIDEISACRRLE